MQKNHVICNYINIYKGDRIFMISIHTFELSLEADGATYHKHRNRVKHKKKYHRASDTDYSYFNDGMMVLYRINYKKKIKLIINPTRLLGGDDVVKLWEPKNKNIRKL